MVTVASEGLGVEPRRCFHFQGFGHLGRSCRSLQGGHHLICISCGGAGHDGDYPGWAGPVQCYHCGGAYPAPLNLECNRYKYEREILLVRSRVSFPETKKQMLMRLLHQNVKYSQSWRNLSFATIHHISLCLLHLTLLPTFPARLDPPHPPRRLPLCHECFGDFCCGSWWNHAAEMLLHQALPRWNS